MDVHSTQFHSYLAYHAVGDTTTFTFFFGARNFEHFGRAGVRWALLVGRLDRHFRFAHPSLVSQY